MAEAECALRLAHIRKQLRPVSNEHQHIDAITGFVQDKLVCDAESCVTLSQLRSLWPDSDAIKLSDFKNGLVHVLETGCKENSSFRGVPAKNFFIGWRIKDENE